jgi:hypothetical protein
MRRLPLLSCVRPADAPELEPGLEELAAEDPEALANLPCSTAVVEQALVAGGDVRLRLVATLKLRQLPGEAELDVEVRAA